MNGFSAKVHDQESPPKTIPRISYILTAKSKAVITATLLGLIAGKLDYFKYVCQYSLFCDSYFILFFQI